MEDIILPDTSLCAIVRDEKMNPAGGIERFIKSIAPHVEEAIIVYTGSLDGTREILDEQTLVFSNLKVYDYKWNGYADARNASLNKARTKYTLVLDADEIILQEDFIGILEKMWEIGFLFPRRLDPFRNKYLGLKFSFLCITFGDAKDFQNYSGHKQRFFQIKNSCYHGFSGEFLQESCLHYSNQFLSLEKNILHFLPDYLALEKKESKWYGTDMSCSPSQIAEFNLWKQYNQKRDLYRASNLDDPNLT